MEKSYKKGWSKARKDAEEVANQQRWLQGVGMFSTLAELAASVAAAVAVGWLQLKPVSSYSRSRFQFFSGNGRLPSNRQVGW